MIQKKIRNEEYASIDDFQKDVEQIMNNAKTYYDSADKEYVDGCALYAVFKKTLAKVMATPSTDEDRVEHFCDNFKNTENFNGTYTAKK